MGDFVRQIMKDKGFASIVIVFFIVCVVAFSHFAFGEEKGASVSEKELCAKMIRFGKQAYQRGKYLDAKEFFRKAVKADPESSLAWQYYDMAVVFALAEKVEKNSDLIAPDTSVRGETPAGSAAKVAPPAPKVTPAPRAKAQMEEEEEGC
jgi:hypothetical protein